MSFWFFFRCIEFVVDYLYYIKLTEFESFKKVNMFFRLFCKITIVTVDIDKNSL